MEVLREIINSDRLKTLFTVPKSMENMDVEVIVLPLADKRRQKREVDVEAALKNITGIIQDEGMSLEDYRNERLENMQVLIDTNVVLDVLMQRSGYELSGRVLQMSGKGIIRGFLSASAVTDIYYILNRQMKDRVRTVDSIKTILSLIDVADVTGEDIREALDSGWKDFEDCVQNRVAVHNHARYIVTRNIKDYEGGGPQPVTPEEFLKHMEPNE